jgi:hypothetical protein
MKKHPQKRKMPLVGSGALSVQSSIAGRNRNPSPKVTNQNCPALLNSLRHAERMVDARQISRLPEDHPRRKVSLAGGGS